MENRNQFDNECHSNSTQLFPPKRECHITATNLPSILNSKSNCNINFYKQISSKNQNKNKTTNKNSSKQKMNRKYLSSDFSVYHSFVSSLNELEENLNLNNNVISSESSSISVQNNDGFQITNFDHLEDTISNFYNDEKPPAYNEIIKR